MIQTNKLTIVTPNGGEAEAYLCAELPHLNARPSRPLPATAKIKS